MLKIRLLELIQIWIPEILHPLIRLLKRPHMKKLLRMRRLELRRSHQPRRLHQLRMLLYLRKPQRMKVQQVQQQLHRPLSATVLGKWLHLLLRESNFESRSNNIMAKKFTAAFSNRPLGPWCYLNSAKETHKTHAEDTEKQPLFQEL